jgi:hypothetical protein
LLDKNKNCAVPFSPPSVFSQVGGTVFECHMDSFPPDGGLLFSMVAQRAVGIYYAAENNLLSTTMQHLISPSHQ